MKGLGIIGLTLGILGLAAVGGYLGYLKLKKDLESKASEAIKEAAPSIGKGIGSGAVESLFENVATMLDPATKAKAGRI